MYKAEEASYMARISKSKKMGYPMFGIGIDYQLITPRNDIVMDGNGKDMIMPMVTLTLPIYRKKYSSMVRESEYMLNASQEKQNDILNNLKVEIQNIILDVKNFNRRIEQYKWQMILTNQSLSILTAGYSSTGTNLSDVLIMQQKLLDLKFKLIETQVDKQTIMSKLEAIISCNKEMTIDNNVK